MSVQMYADRYVNDERANKVHVYERQINEKTSLPSTAFYAAANVHPTKGTDMVFCLIDGVNDLFVRVDVHHLAHLPSTEVSVTPFSASLSSIASNS